jgi:hypothetical protein
MLRSLKSGIAQLHWSRWLVRLLKVMAILAVLAVALHFGVRYLVWPQIEKSKPALEKLIGSRLGITVTMDDVRVAWDGLRPEFEIDGLRFYSQTAAKVSNKKFTCADNPIHIGRTQPTILLSPNAVFSEVKYRRCRAHCGARIKWGNFSSWHCT